MEKAEKELEKVKIEDEVTDVVCEECGRNMVSQIRTAWKIPCLPGIPGLPKYEAVSGKNRSIACPICGKDVVIKKTKKGRKYYGCENNPECEFMSWQKPSAKTSVQNVAAIW